MPEIVQKRYYESAEVFWLNREALLEELRKIAKKIGIRDKNVKRIILFGSHAGGRDTAFSDIDVFVYTEDEFENSTFRNVFPSIILFKR